MSEISDLKQRVEAVGQKFGRLAEQESSYGERLAGLLNAVEEGFARSQRETQTLKAELQNATSELQNTTSELQNTASELENARSDVMKLTDELDAAKDEARRRSSERDDARDESKQLRGMLLALLEAVETGGNLDLGSTMRNLESRIDRIVSTTDADLDTTPKEDTKVLGAEIPQPAEDAGFRTLVDEAGRPVDDDWKRRRREAFLEVFALSRPNALVVETFPFGRGLLRFELEPLLDAALDRRRRPLTCVSVRDILRYLMHKMAEAG